MEFLLEVSALVAESGQAARDFGEGFVEQPVAPCIAQIGHGERYLARVRGLPDHVEPARMRLRIRGQELAPVGGGEVADLENRLEVLVSGSAPRIPDWRSAR